MTTVLESERDVSRNAVIIFQNFEETFYDLFRQKKHKHEKKTLLDDGLRSVAVERKRVERLGDP